MPLHQTLLSWYDISRRTFLFRGTHDPYRIWISEIMLQQTRTETVEPYFQRFMTLFPSVEALATAQEEDVLRAWAGLGYYSRARNLHAAARKVWYELDGVFPHTVDGLLSLPGVGPYTAAAIASIAFDVPAPSMDGNLTRVFARVHGIRENVEIPSVKRQLQAIAESEMPDKRCGDFNQALMDLGATICTPGTPECDRCPIRGYCAAYKDGDADMLPVKSVKKAPRQLDMAVVLVTCKNRILMTQRKENLLKNLWVFPLMEDISQENIVSQLPEGNYTAPIYLGDGRHVFTHLIWNMRIYHLCAENAFAYPNGKWVALSEMEDLPKPTAIKAAIQHARELLTPAIQPVTQTLLPAMGKAYAASWQQSHAHMCSETFLAQHDENAMTDKLCRHIADGKKVYALSFCGEARGVMVLDGDKNELCALYIHPAWQGMGIGHAAMDAALRLLDAGRDMVLTVLTDNARARQLYESFGFIPNGSLRVLDENRGIKEMDYVRKAQK